MHVEVAHVAAAELPDGVRVAVLPSPIGIASVEEGAEAPLGHRRRVLERLHERGELCFTSAANLVARERGLAQRDPQELESGAEVVAQELPVDDRAVAPGGGVERRAEGIDRARELLRGERSRAPRQRIGRERRETLLAGGILGRAGADHDVELDQRDLVVLGDDDAEAVLQRHARDRWQLEWLRRPGEDGEQQDEEQRRATTHRGAPSAVTGTSTTVVRFSVRR